ncbi:hypothetical protein [Lentzea sp. NPDC055074]
MGLLQPGMPPLLEKIVSFGVDDRMSLYEYESSLRQMALVRGLLAPMR